MESAASDFHCKMSMGNLLFMQTCPSSLASKIHIEILLIELSLVHLGLKETDLFRPSNLGQGRSWDLSTCGCCMSWLRCCNCALCVYGSIDTNWEEGLQQKTANLTHGLKRFALSVLYRDNFVDNCICLFPVIGTSFLQRKICVLRKTRFYLPWIVLFLVLKGFTWGNELFSQ